MRKTVYQNLLESVMATVVIGEKGDKVWFGMSYRAIIAYDWAFIDSAWPNGVEFDLSDTDRQVFGCSPSCSPFEDGVVMLHTGQKTAAAKAGM